ncbi:tear acid lipase-like protein [Peromyscus californicus insignis]|uniref:tear acid lipase-like protein n=1 Tax=Peromyscus californicus insignis TaxID=564181 RepID=UPI0022A6D3C0|nr:tear acid lipase-like protein [Peromyscus californicus insignis]
MTHFEFYKMRLNLQSSMCRSPVSPAPFIQRMSILQVSEQTSDPFIPVKTFMSTLKVKKSHIDVYAGQIPAGTSVRSILHFSQGIRTGLFQAYNWDSESLNMHHYNQSTPPIYNVENMKVQTVIWNGGQDILANPIDVKNLVAKTYNLVYHKKIGDYNHLDFIIGKDVAEKVYNDLFAFIKKDQSG